ncbi:hypothetical protein PTSG_10266 [Salpingoeca rosetta]|uniref:Chalcone isomerase domain-containing protein n=1 Tax=Salpingoeca rosetta (strain ATCC 50818 / BSB-021) TaxID=946362 RepID=F2UQT1_SALR5|nr:uncharacterized protein PTSG_10266 [Salpingoeca rosetta]EGD79986.1 hypothetical protein PTSG_10266 [Salpingoeca rosetta]|eukprot:XP_004988607.1 hypothetical protein PTSG_10266 [Salpingoeca rosetta]
MAFARLFARAAATVAGAGVAAAAVATSAASPSASLMRVPAHAACEPIHEPLNPNSTSVNPDDEQVVDRDSGKSFLRHISMFSGVPGALIGAACRRRFGLISVYGVGLYVAESEATSLNAPTDILKGTVEAELQLKFCRTVERETITASIRESMEPRMPDNQKGALDGFIDALHDFLDGPAYDGMLLGFHWDGSVLTTYAEGERHEHHAEMGIKSEAIPRALFAVYLDEDAVVPPEKFVEGLDQLKQANAPPQDQE